MVSANILDQVEKIRGVSCSDVDGDVGIACEAAAWLVAVLADEDTWKRSLTDYTIAGLAFEFSGITAVRHALTETMHPAAPSFCDGIDRMLGAIESEALRRGSILAVDADPGLEFRASIAALHICLSIEDGTPPLPDKTVRIQ